MAGAYQAILGQAGMLYPPQVAAEGFVQYGRWPYAAASGGGLFYARDSADLQPQNGAHACICLQ